VNPTRRRHRNAGRPLLRELPVPPAAVTLDIDYTVDVVHRAQQLSF
jgi:hypothetical protein